MSSRVLNIWQIIKYETFGGKFVAKHIYGKQACFFVFKIMHTTVKATIYHTLKRIKNNHSSSLILALSF